LVFSEPVNTVEKNRELSDLEMIKIIVMSIDNIPVRVYRLKLKNRVIAGITELKRIEQ
jgi:histidyl-tRNA synthetase